MNPSPCRRGSFSFFWIHEHADYDFSKERNRQLFIQGKVILERHYRGNKLNYILLEGLSPQTRLAMFSLGLKELCTFPAGTPLSIERERSQHELVLTGLGKDQALSELPGTPAVDLFVHRTPICQFDHREQMVLELALEGMTNVDIAAALGVVLDTVKGRWTSIFGKMKSAGLLAEDDSNTGVATPPRKLEKRRAALQYVRDHPEELRPFVVKRQR